LEQQRQELAFRESEQQHTVESEQQLGFSSYQHRKKAEKISSRIDFANNFLPKTSKPAPNLIRTNKNRIRHFGSFGEELLSSFYS